MTIDIFHEFQAEDVADDMLAEAAELFSEHYGTWGTLPPGAAGAHIVPGRRVKMSGARLRRECLPTGARCSYVRVEVDGVLAGHACACRWSCEGRQVCWITQLVVHGGYRRRRLATGLIRKLRRGDDEVFGIMSSHPAALMALSKACADSPLPRIPLDFARDNAAGIMALSPIPYIKDAKLRGSLFSKDSTDSLVSGADTSFFVDHREPSEALAWLRERGAWILGNLPDGHEYLLVFESPRRTE